jgi:hypothetical protein
MENDVTCAAKLMEVILQNCRGRVDACVPAYLALVLHRLNLPELNGRIMQVHMSAT